jgi:hypothetical protein
MSGLAGRCVLQALSGVAALGYFNQESDMRTLIPSSDDELNEDFFAAWFDLWSTLQDDLDPADAYAAYCAF